MQNIIEGEACRVAEWSIDNFSCWNDELHEKVIRSPKSQETPTFIVELYPRGLRGNGEHLVVYLTCEDNRTFRGNVSVIGSEGSVLCQQKVYSKEQKKVLELPPGPKFGEVVAHIRKNEVLHGDRLIVRYQIWSPSDVREHMHTTIDALEVSFKIYPEIFNSIESTHSIISLLSFPLKETDIKPMGLSVYEDQNDRSKIVLTLNPLAYQKKALVRTRMSVLNNEDVVRTEENKHLFRNWDFWDFCSSLTIEEVQKRGFSLILHFKIIPSRNCKHSFGLYQYRPFKIDIMKLNRITPTSEEQSSKSLPTVTSHNPESSLTVLSSELMCLYQDQDFSDFQLKSGDVSIPVHRNILSARSPVFKTMLSTDMQEAASGCMDIQDIDPSTLSRFLAFLYTGAVEGLQGESALKLYYAADKYEVTTLKRECVGFLCNNVSISNVCDILSLSNKHQDEQLNKMARDFFLNNYNEVLISKEWKSFMRSEPLLAVETLTHFGEKKYVRKGDAS